MEGPKEYVRTSRFRTGLAWLSAACAVLVVFGSCDYRTSREWPANANGFNAGSSMIEGFGQWAGWTFLLGLLVIAILVAWPLVEWRWAGVGVVAALAFAAAAFIAGRHWFKLLDERELDRVYKLNIAAGLPIVTIAGVAGSILALLLAALCVWTNHHKTCRDGDPFGR